MRTTRRASTGGHAVYVTGTSDLVRGRDAVFLTALDAIEELRPEETRLVADGSPRFRTSRLYLESLLRRTPPAGTALSLGHRAALDPADYQLQPAVKALAQPRPRILMADGVGLGKTVEVGILLAELIARGRGDRILVVCLKSILAQFQKELWSRFTIPLVRLDSVGIQRVRSKIPSTENPFYFFDRAIISIDTLKKDRKYRRFLEESRWDAIVIDECQNVADRSGARTTSAGASQRYRLARLLARTTDALILTSATPHDGKPESFASLMNLLEPTAVADPSNFTKDEVEGYFLRRFKKDVAGEVGEAFRERELRPLHIDAGREECAALAAIQAATFKTVERVKHGKGKGILFRTLLLKGFLSSPAACLETIGERLKKLDALDAAGQDAENVAHDRAALEAIAEKAGAVEPAVFSKLARFLDEMRPLLDDGERVVVFSERIATLKLLQERLCAKKGAGGLALKADAAPIFHGALDDQRQRELLESFQAADSKIRVLLASDAASEGLNLHFHCRHLVHFDLPWSLITLEQRNGRIDRFGQPRTPIITYLITRTDDEALKADLRVLDVLWAKEQVAHEQLGDAAMLMNLHDAEAEEEHLAQTIEEEADPEGAFLSPAQADALLALFGTGSEPTPERREPLRLFPDDLDYAREAFEQALGPDTDLIEWHENLAGFTLRPPDDLLRRFDYLPPELIRAEGKKQNAELKLTTDRRRVADALDAARAKSDAWPEWQLFWELNPVSQWLDDKVLEGLARHEAPVIPVSEGLAEREVCFVFQGILSNERGRAVVVEWFGVSYAGGRKTGIRSLEALLEATGLRAGPPNRGGLDQEFLDALGELRRFAVGSARTHLESVAKRRESELADLLDEGLHRLEAWRAKRVAQREARRRKIAEKGRQATTFERKRFEAEKQNEDEIHAERKAWIKEEMTTVDKPFVRLAAVLIKEK
ncbi:DEAD/DEAH box helicase [Engelhardtia mirabilis]|uniref:RNA polymerase-associated protein RapA n=1 Tax=Engelhardtia mirabilis TaxID=2528011 RepID=A0A518BRN2_9BACT|nr:RNA polymerase-associated protein RapA [Planctomycetes bacterium Pla133]QDV03961.1 RNA polymerase-associated protein RapA [Planctomycetes bacterium Pla86]